ncbi:hypothetical protein [Acinetobacter pittii]|uniref:Uncharacterized protein n=1 Tax=Acinetobacter pittii TaxID=48296 RepID=A0A6S4VCH2_ACIPI|nr:hypothetical protein [Acinetobacter pittii]MBN6508813.1 hypothetical protein [Acinetobacter pittii]MDX8187214.1 hypothetical protein [Acinetobacter pittii]OCY92048.1 hypothetical protein BFR67_04610 [Acinetobacter pittii]WPP83122.1 hypothetical protein SOI74_10230 [Acinetobacter pittii]BBQ50235.1 hypothetical protein WP2W18E11_32330 [Acinetobacter pittii]
MIFQLDIALFKSEKLWLDIETLLNLVSKSDRHKILKPSIESPDYNNWWSSLSSQRKYFFNEIFSMSDRISFQSLKCPRYMVSISNGGSNIDINKAIVLVNTSFKIYVENARNDKNFIKFFCRSENKSKFLEYCINNEIEFVNGGGITELGKTILETPVDKSYSFFIFDRDSLPFTGASSQSNSIKALCEEEKIQHHQLKRRCIENYLPKKSLINLIELRKGPKKTLFRNKVNAYLDIKCDQIIHNINMKTGIDGDLSRITELKLSVEDVYKLSSISLSSRTLLASGFSKGISIAYQDNNHKLKLNESEILKDRSAYDEVNQIIDHILRML